GSAVGTSSEDHGLLHAPPESFTEDIIDVSRTNYHRSSGPGPVPINERPRQGGTDHRQPRQMKRPSEAPAEKSGSKRVLKEPRTCGARGFRGPPEGDDRGGSADGLQSRIPRSSLHAGDLVRPTGTLSGRGERTRASAPLERVVGQLTPPRSSRNRLSSPDMSARWRHQPRSRSSAEQGASHLSGRPLGRCARHRLPPRPKT